MAWGNRQKLASRALVEGDLDAAAAHLGATSSQPNYQVRRLTRRLTAALIQRAENATAIGNLAAAWKDISTATLFSNSKDEDHISRQKNQLVELTIESADSLMSVGKTTHAVQLVDQLKRRQIMDWRADRICSVARCLHQSEDLSAHGKFMEAIEQLEKAKNLQPDLPFLESRLAAGRQRAIQIKELNAELQSTALKSQWVDVCNCCQKILAIAPKHQIALDAHRHCLSQIKRKTSVGSRVTSVPERTKLSKSNSFFQFGKKQSGNAELANSELANSHPAETPNSNESFLLWVDGVGGYLVCTNKINMVGQAVSQSNVSIPIVGDLRRRHARLETVGGHHLLEPLGKIAVDGLPVESAVELKNKQVIALDQGVKLKYSQTHPLSKTARLDFVSRHRTHPWSDAVLLVSQSIILGPNRSNHIYCPAWGFDLVIFERDGKWFCRAKEPFEIDDQRVDQEGEIQFNSRIVGEDYSLTLEPVE